MRNDARLVSSCPSFVAMVQAADLRDRYDSPHLRQLGRPWFRGILLQREMRT